MAGRLADGWVPSLRPDGPPLADMVDRLDQSAADAGRHPGDIRRILNIGGTITDGPSSGILDGPAVQWVDELSAFAIDLGFDTFITSGDDDDHLRRFAVEVVPDVRARVAAARRTV